MTSTPLPDATSAADAPSTARVDAPTRLERYAPLVAGVMLALPVLLTRYPPMTDLPLHEALVGLLRHWGDTSMLPEGLYARNFGEPNQLFHMIAWALSAVMPTDTACKLVVFVTIAAIPICGARLADHVGASRLTAVLLSPLALGWTFAWGLVANLAGLAAFLALLPTLDRFAAKPTPRGALACLGAAIVLYFAHQAMLVVFAGAALCLVLLHPFSLRATLWRLTPFLASLAITVAQIRYQERFKTPTLRAVPTMFVSAVAKLQQVPAIVLPTYERTTQLAFFALFALGVALLFLLRARERSEPVPRSPRAFVLRYRFELLAIGCFLAYLAFPLTLNGATLVYQRFLPPAIAVFVITAAPRSLATRAARVTRLLACAMPVAALLMVFPSFADSHQAYKDLDVLLAKMENGAAVATLDLATSETRTFSLGPAPARYLATRGGRLHYAFTDSTISPVVMNPEYQWNEVLVRISKNGWSFRPAYDLKHFRYVIVRSIDARLLVLASHAMMPEARPVANAGEWLLLESTLPLAPLTSPEEPMPTPKPATLRKRMQQKLEELPKESGEPTPELGPEQESTDPVPLH